MLDYRHRPISSRTEFAGDVYRGDQNPFKATFEKTMALLERELTHLKAEHVIIEIDVAARAIRADGMLRADASTAQTSPAVRLVFDTPQGPMQFATHRFGWDPQIQDKPMARGWHQNLRAIALGLEALRSVNRYGISRSGQQYRGYQQLTGAGGDMSAEKAWQVLRGAVKADAGDPDFHSAASLYRRAAKLLHPNSTWTGARPSRADWDEVQAAARRLNLSEWTS